MHLSHADFYSLLLCGIFLDFENAELFFLMNEGT